ncbi:MAG: TolC family protein [Planctomycetes bacterium]|nr:TolC family protein [Planctomycetota bacterium]
MSAVRNFFLWPLAASLTACHAGLDRERILERSEWLYADQVETEPVLRSLPSRQRSPEPPAGEVRSIADIDRYVGYGLRENAGLRAAYERWRAALERVPQVTSLPDPQLGFTQFVEDLQTRTGPQQRRYSLTQTLPWFGKLELRGAVADGAAEEQWFEVAALRLRVARDVTVAFYDYAYLARSLQTTRAVFDLLRGIEPVVQRRIAGGTGGQQDLLRLQVEIGRIENELASLDKVRPATSARLQAAMNWRGEGELPLPELTEPRLAELEVEVLLARALEHNPELRRLCQGIRRSQQALELARLEPWPDLALGVDYLETGAAATAVAGSGDDPWGVRVSMTLPVGRGRYAAAEREAERNLAAASHALDDRRANLRADLQHAVFQLDDNGRQVVLYRETLLPRSRESLEVTRAAYSAGTSTLLDLIDSERALLGFEIAYWRACRDYHQSRARLETLIGGAL